MRTRQAKAHVTTIAIGIAAVIADWLTWCWQNQPQKSLERVIVEYRQQAKLRSHGLSARRKLLLVGPPGCGKTMTASALAVELNLPLLSVRLDGLITKYLGESAAKLRQVFDSMVVKCGVYLFDEFDAIGSDRARPNEVGEIQRVLNSFLQSVEADNSDSLILAATNQVEVLDPALFRRFDDVIRYGLPTADAAEELTRNALNVFTTKGEDWAEVRRACDDLSYAEIARAYSHKCSRVTSTGAYNTSTGAYNPLVDSASND